MLQYLRIHLCADLVLGKIAGHAHDDHVGASGGRTLHPAHIRVGASGHEGAQHRHDRDRAHEGASGASDQSPERERPDPSVGRSGDRPRCGHSTSGASGAMMGTFGWRPRRTRTVVGPLPFTSRVSEGPKSYRSASSLAVHSETRKRPGPAFVSSLLARFTVSPHRSYANLWTPITPATAGAVC